MVTSGALLGAAAMVMTSGQVPAGSRATLRFICTTPTKPGVMPKNRFSAGRPPMVAAAGEATRDSGEAGDRTPVSTGLSRRPPPVRYTRFGQCLSAVKIAFVSP